MSLLNKAKLAIGSKPYDDEYDYDSYDGREYDEYEEEKPRRKGIFSFLSRKNYEDEEDYDDYEEKKEPRNTKSSDRYTSAYASSSSSSKTDSSYSSSKYSGSSIRYEKPSASSFKSEMTMLYPMSFDNAADIVREVKSGKITVFDVSQIESSAEARRVVDYICGAAEGMECPFSWLCPSVFCMAPKGIKLNVKKPKQRP